MSDGASSGLRALGIVLIVVGIVLLIVGVVYFTVAADKLPAFMGHMAHATGHRSKRAIAGVVGGVVLLVAGGIALARAR